MQRTVWIDSLVNTAAALLLSECQARRKLGEGGWMESAGVLQGPRSHLVAPAQPQTLCQGLPPLSLGQRQNRTHKPRGSVCLSSPPICVKNVVAPFLMPQICYNTRNLNTHCPSLTGVPRVARSSPWGHPYSYISASPHAASFVMGCHCLVPPALRARLTLLILAGPWTSHFTASLITWTAAHMRVPRVGEVSARSRLCCSTNRPAAMSCRPCPI